MRVVMMTLTAVRRYGQQNLRGSVVSYQDKKKKNKIICIKCGGFEEKEQDVEVTTAGGVVTCKCVEGVKETNAKTWSFKEFFMEFLATFYFKNDVNWIENKVVHPLITFCAHHLLKISPIKQFYFYLNQFEHFEVCFP